MVLTHGAGADCRSRLLTELAEALAASGTLVLRCDLPFRQKRAHGPPFFGSAAEDREGLRRAATLLKKESTRRVYLGGHSYGGRQATILSAEQPGLVDGLLLLSYPLHPPRKPLEMRTSHFHNMQTPALFVHGTRDPFGTQEEMSTALELIPARHRLLEIQGAGHELLPRSGSAEDLIARIIASFEQLL